MAWLLDTNILSEGRKPKPEPRVTGFYDAQPLNALYISVVSIAEIRFGIELQEDATRRAELNDWLTRTLRPAFARADIAGNGRHTAQMADVNGRRPEDRTHLFTSRSRDRGNGPSARAYGRDPRSERFR